MINELVISIFDFIFSCNQRMKTEPLDKRELNTLLNEKIEKISNVYDFWNEYKYFFNDCLIDASTLDGNQYIYKDFPKFKINTLKEYLEYKKDLIWKSIKENGVFKEDEFEKITKEICNEGKKTILDYCEKIRTIKYIGKVFLAADDNPAYEIAYGNIEANYEDTIIKNDSILKSAFLIEYNKIKKIEDSANSEIWLVEDDEKKQYIAKILNKNISKEKLARYRNEINFCKTHYSRYLIEVLDNGLTSVDGIDYMFYIMKKYDKNFRKMMKEGIDDSKKLYYYNQILEGIKFIHNNGCFHRDIKPENLLFDSQNDIIVVADLGIAHFNGDELIDDPKTKLTSKMGNYQYAAPEQRMRGIEPNYQCDIYALGLILNELFTGILLQGSFYKKIADVNPSFSYLDTIVEKMIAQNPNDRYGNIEEIQYDINAYIQIYNTEEAIQKLKKIQIEHDKTVDLLTVDPIKIIDVDLDDNGRLTITLNHEPNSLWYDLFMHVSKQMIMGFEPEKYEYIKNKARLELGIRRVDYAPKLVEYFKEWVSSTNSEYPQKREIQLKEQELAKQREAEEKIKKAEKLNEVRKKFKI